MEANWVEETSACQASGISRSTLLRFAEAGYLKTKQNSGGSVLYDPSEIAQVFGIEVTIPKVNPIVKEEPFVPTQAPSTLSFKDEEDTRPLPDFVPEASLASKVTVGKDAVEQAKPPAPPTENTLHAAELQRQKLLGAIDLLERMLQSKDAEIEDLRQQRSWLRDRVQRLEEKSDRDQLLLLAETQTLRRMIELQSPKKSIMERTLAALGFLPAPEEQDPSPEARKTVSHSNS